MSDDEKVYSQSEVETIKALERIETKQNVLNDSFNAHKQEDAEHFDRLYDADKEILNEISKIPERMMQCSNKIKKDIMEDVEEKFVNITDFKVFKTWIVTSVTVGVGAGTVIGAFITYGLQLMKITGS